jgi:2-(1,2-epoxy-1,2-dihydrophenyl)acetyl-CoA isomerase
VALTKSLITREAELSIEGSFEREAESQARCISSEDHREAIAAFLEKRPPKYSGR